MKTNEELRLRYSWDLILCIEDFINCINLHKQDLKSPRNISIMQYRKDLCNDKNYNPALALNDYIYLEANSFFQYAKKLKDKNKKMPDLPDYLPELKKYRNESIAHKDFKEKYKSGVDWMFHIEDINKLIPIKQIIKDVDEYYKKIYKLWEEELKRKL